MKKRKETEMKNLFILVGRGIITLVTAVLIIITAYACILLAWAMYMMLFSGDMGMMIFTDWTAISSIIFRGMQVVVESLLSIGIFAFLAMVLLMMRRLVIDELISQTILVEK